MEVRCFVEEVPPELRERRCGWSPRSVISRVVVGGDHRGGSAAVVCARILLRKWVRQVQVDAGALRDPTEEPLS